jgi:predicted acylesterase/phospholipase RssA
VSAGGSRRATRYPPCSRAPRFRGVFPSIEFEGRKLVDGGVAENTPIADAVALGAEVIYVLPTGGGCALPQAPQGAIQMLVHALTLLINQRLVQDIETYSHDARLVVFPPPCPQPVPAWDLGHAAELIEQGYRSASAVLEGDCSEASGARSRSSGCGPTATTAPPGSGATQAASVTSTPFQNAT